jgi:hypothetical protein
MSQRVQEAAIWLTQLNDAVEMGGFRQWLEEGHGRRVQPLLAVIGLGKAVSPLPKSLKVIERVLEEIANQRLQEPGALNHDAVPCDVCGGRAHLDDDHSACPACDGEGLVLKGAFVHHERWLNAASDAYLKLTSAQRQTERLTWCQNISK